MTEFKIELLVGFPRHHFRIQVGPESSTRIDIESLITYQKSP